NDKSESDQKVCVERCRFAAAQFMFPLSYSSGIADTRDDNQVAFLCTFQRKSFDFLNNWICGFGNLLLHCCDGLKNALLDHYRIYWNAEFCSFLFNFESLSSNSTYSCTYPLAYFACLLSFKF